MANLAEYLFEAVCVPRPTVLFALLLWPKRLSYIQSKELQRCCSDTSVCAKDTLQNSRPLNLPYRFVQAGTSSPQLTYGIPTHLLSSSLLRLNADYLAFLTAFVKKRNIPTQQTNKPWTTKDPTRFVWILFRKILH